jgi:transcriptional regulator with XRE-family HTH domain
MKTTGEIIREKRETKGLLLRQVASRLDVDNAILSKIERGERKATKEQILKLATILNINQDELLVQFLSEKIAYTLLDECDHRKVLKVAEAKVNYYKSKSKK